MVVHTPAQVLEALVGLLHEGGRPIVGIDGMPGSGKSTLAATLSPLLGARVVALDEYLDDSGKDRYVQSLRLADVAQTISTSPSVTIVEGVCLLQVLELIEVAPTVLLYVKGTIGIRGLGDSSLCESSVPPSVIIARELEKIRAFEQDAGEPLSENLEPPLEEVIEYCARYRPLRRATLEYWGATT